MFFHPDHLASLRPLLRATTAAHPRLHLLWPSLLALLLPGFAPKRVGPASASSGSLVSDCCVPTWLCQLV